MVESTKKASPCYSSLNGLSFQFRLLDLSPGRWHDQLRGKLRIVSLDRKPPFEALSYTWGSPATGGKTIAIDNDHHLPITENLFVALRRLRSVIVQRTVWVDAICINQDDLAEQGRQVSIMGDVYEAAIRVLIWLGEYSNATLYDHVQMRRPHFKQRSKAYLRNSRGRKFALALNEAIASTEPKWHDRAWIIQEFSMAREIRLCFGPISMLYDPIHMVDLMLHSAEPLEDLRAFHAKVSDMRKLKLGSREPKQSISEAILYTSAASCSKPRDKVYSLLSLIDPNESQIIRGDFRERSEQAFARATIAAIVARLDFQIFELIGFNQPRVANLPTWAVDFTMRHSPVDGRIHQMEHASVVWMDVERETTGKSFDSNLQHLVLTGVQLDKVSTTMQIKAITASVPGNAVADGLAELLNTLVRTHASHRGDNTTLSFAHTHATSTTGSDDLLIYGPETRVFNVIHAAFVLWNNATGFSRRHGKGALPSFHMPIDSDGRNAGLSREILDSASKFTSSVIPYMEYAHFVSAGCVFFATAEGFIGLAPNTLAEDDLIILVSGSKFPMIVRRDGDAYLFRGLAYVHGIWNKELVSAWKDKHIVQREYVLI